MFATKTNRSALAIPMLSALLVTLLSATAMTAPAATVTSSAHYQKRITLTCVGLVCSGNFPAVADKRRLNLTRLTCLLNASSGSTFSVGSLKLRDASNAILFEEYVAFVYSSSNGEEHAINQAVDMQVAAGQSTSVQMNVGSGTVGGADCVAIGMLDTLQ